MNEKDEFDTEFDILQAQRGYFPSPESEMTVKWCAQVHSAAFEILTGAERYLSPDEQDMLTDALGFMLDRADE